MEQKHWLEQLKEAESLKSNEQYEEAYSILREIYEKNSFRYDKIIHANYEDYIEGKVTFFVDLAKLSMLVTDTPAQSIPYLDEALIMLDGSESVLPYIDIDDIKRLRSDYRKLAQ
ncbi:MAG: hypothetical protein ACRCWY_00880 [Cellulosilyticaceae bacterium]